MIWRCPRCIGQLAEIAESLGCVSCEARYDCVGGIPDLRLPGPSWIDQQADCLQARRLLAETSDLSVEAMVRHVYSSRPGWTDARIARRTWEVLSGPARLRADVKGWLRPCLNGVGADEPFLDLGCGAGTLLAAAAAEGHHGIGIDVSMVWLVVASRMIAENGGRPVLAAAMAEAMPLADGAVSGVVSLDVIEHVAEPESYLRAIDRVTRPSGWIALATPNRFSLMAEPHVSVWGVGWLPRRLQQRFVRWRSGDPYDYTRLLSTWEVARLLSGCTRFAAKIELAEVAEAAIVQFPRWRALAARFYNRLVRLHWFNWPFLVICPFFRVIGTKQADRARLLPERHAL